MTHSYGVLLGVPARVQLVIVSMRRLTSTDFTHNLFRKVDVVRLQTVLLSWHFASRTANLLCLKRRLIRLQDRVLIAVDIVDPEVVVVRSSEDVPAPASAYGLRRRSELGMTYSPLPLNVHSNLSKMQSFSYRSQSF